MEGHDLWVLFPYYGLDLDMDGHGLHDPMFETLHVMPRSQLPSLISELKSPILFGPNTLGDEFEAFLCVRTPQYDNFDVNKTREAELFGAIIAVAVYSTNHIYATSLFEKLGHLNSENRLAADIVNGRSACSLWGEMVRLSSVAFHPKSLSCSRNSLKDLILSNDLGFGRKLLLKSEELPSSLSGRLRAAVLILDNAFHQRDYSIQVLMCTTVMETLFKKETDYSKFKERVSTIFGWSTLHLEFEEVIQKRHDFVHRGIEVDDQGITYKALCLALGSIVAYSSLTPYYATPIPIKNTHFDYFLDCLDRASKSSTFQSYLDECFSKYSRIENLKFHIVQHKPR